jgi:catechol 2,3-dioxygenase-like lactoylglutathione lyase family enzyme
MSFAAAGGRTPKPQHQEAAMSQTTTHIRSVGRVMVPVADQDRAIEFYVETLGFEKRADVPYGNGDRWVEVAPPGASTAIALVLPREGNPSGVDTRIALTTDDVERVHADLSDAGVDVDQEIMRGGGPVPPMFWFRDQDGNTLLLVEAS